MAIIEVYIILLVIFTIAYSFLIGWYSLNISRHDLMPGNTPAGFSIIIAARNEEDNIPALIRSLGSQRYPQEFYEVIIVDDHSSDNTYEVVQGLINKPDTANFNVVRADPVQTGFSPKKSALLKGINKARFEYIITLDADCEMGTDWLEAYARTCQKSYDLIAGPVLMKGSSFFQKLQSLEMLALMGVTQAVFKIGSPFLCNGANLAFKKKTFYELGGYSGSEHMASGDDIFLLYKMRDSGRNLSFMADPDAVVQTQALDDFRAFVNQRMRWASKWSSKLNWFSVLNSLTVFGLSFLLIAGLVLSLNHHYLAILVLTCWVVKSIFDFLILFLVSGIYNSRNLLNYFLPLQLIYPFYTAGIGILANFRKYEWKGRTHK